MEGGNSTHKYKINKSKHSVIRFNCKTDSPSYIVKLLILIHHQKTRDRVAAQWLQECGNSGERRSRRNIKTTAVRYFG